MSSSCEHLANGSTFLPPPTVPRIQWSLRPRWVPLHTVPGPSPPRCCPGASLALCSWLQRRPGRVTAARGPLPPPGLPLAFGQLGSPLSPAPPSPSIHSVRLQSPRPPRPRLPSFLSPVVLRKLPGAPICSVPHHSGAAVPRPSPPCPSSPRPVLTGAAGCLLCHSPGQVRPLVSFFLASPDSRSPQLCPLDSTNHSGRSPLL